MRTKMRMPSKKQYNLVTNDDYDSRIPLHPEEAFSHGIKFNVKVSDSLLRQYVFIFPPPPPTLLLASFVVFTWVWGVSSFFLVPLFLLLLLLLFLAFIFIISITRLNVI